MKARLISTAGHYVGKNMKWTPESIEELTTEGNILEVQCGENRYHLRENDAGQLEIFGQSIGNLWAHNTSGNMLIVLDQPLFTRAIFVDEKEFAS